MICFVRNLKAHGLQESRFLQHHWKGFHIWWWLNAPQLQWFMRAIQTLIWKMRPLPTASAFYIHEQLLPAPSFLLSILHNLNSWRLAPSHSLPFVLHDHLKILNGLRLQSTTNQDISQFSKMKQPENKFTYSIWKFTSVQNLNHFSFLDIIITLALTCSCERETGRSKVWSAAFTI